MNDFACVSDIENFLWNLFTSDLIERKGFSLPSTNDFDSFVVIEIPNPVSDMNAYANGTALVYIYAKPLASGVKNPVIGKIEKEVTRLANESKDTTYTISKRYVYTDYDAGRDLHVNIVEFNLTIG